MASIASTSRTVAASAAIGVALSAFVQARRIQRAARRGRRAARRAGRFERLQAEPAARVLVLGDSTAVGVGAARPEDSIAGRLAAEHPAVEVVNLADSGARVADVLARVQQLRRDGGARFDVALLHAGGNDVLRATPLRALRADAARLLAELGAVARHTVWLGAANVGLAPIFLPPFSWWLSHRGRVARDVFATATQQAGAHFLDFFHGRHKDPFCRDAARYYAADHVHPSSASYLHCYRALKKRTPFLRWLEAADGHVGCRSCDPTAHHAMPPRTDHHTFNLDQPYRAARDDFERVYLQYHLGRQEGSVAGLARFSGLERTNLYRKFQLLGIAPTSAP